MFGNVSAMGLQSYVDIDRCCPVLQVWDTRQRVCCNSFQANEDYISDMTFAADTTQLLATRYVLHVYLVYCFNSTFLYLIFDNYALISFSTVLLLITSFF